MSRAPSVARLQREAAACTRCPLYANATQTVFGEGRTGGLMLVGEQPGDQEDRAGRPFVGPAGRLLRELLGEAGIDADRVYVTNAVKHFKWRPRGTRRIHDKPSWSEVRACGHWLELELETVRPALVVCLGATAAQSLLGRSARVGALRGSRSSFPADSGLSSRSTRPRFSARTTATSSGPGCSPTSSSHGGLQALRGRRPRSPDP